MTRRFWKQGGAKSRVIHSVLDKEQCQILPNVGLFRIAELIGQGMLRPLIVLF